MSIPFTIAVAEVFNNLKVPEYMAALLFSAKTSNKGVSDRIIKSRITWCNVHQDRAIRNFARDKFKQESAELQRNMMSFFRNIRLLLVSAKTYKECVN